MRLIDWFKRLGKKKHAESELSDADCLNLIRYLENCDVDCEEVFNTIDQYVEIEFRKEDAARLMPLIHQHLEMCSGCNDQYEALLDVLAKAQDS